MSESHAHHKPVVGIVPTKLPEPYDDGINHYALAVRSAGAKPYLLPVTDDVGAYETIFPHMDGFLLTGGKDIDPVRYGDTEDDPSVTDHLPGREGLEHLILCYSDEFDVPIMGICRGMQMLNVFYGGSLHLDLATQTKQQTHFANHFQTLPFSEPSHHVTLEPRGSLARILQTHSTQVNSMHHQGIFELAPELRAAAYDDQGLIEAIEHPDKPFTIGVQWHPEFLGTRNSMNLLFERFVDACQEESQHKKEKRANIAIDRIHTGFVWPQVSFIDRQPKITN